MLLEITFATTLILRSRTCTHKRRTCSFQQNFYEKETFFVFVFLSIYLSLLNFQETMNTTMIPKIPKIVFMSVHPWMLFFLRLKSSKPKEKVLLKPLICNFFSFRNLLKKFNRIAKDQNMNINDKKDENKNYTKWAKWAKMIKNDRKDQNN